MIVPTMQISWTLFSILGGGVYFQEYKTFTVLSASMFALGVAVSLPARSAGRCLANPPLGNTVVLRFYVLLRCPPFCVHTAALPQVSSPWDT
jgi:hypothetical protein